LSLLEGTTELCYNAGSVLQAKTSITVGAFGWIILKWI
jgi:hypothetical protein